MQKQTTRHPTLPRFGELVRGEGDITGADVWPMVKAGRLAEVADYCIDDVRKTRAVFKRMTFSNADLLKQAA